MFCMHEKKKRKFLVGALVDAIDVRKSALALRALWVLGNEYLQDVAPWTTFKDNPDAAAMQIRIALNLIRFYAVISSPFIPDASAQLLTAMKSEGAQRCAKRGSARSARVRRSQKHCARCLTS